MPHIVMYHEHRITVDHQKSRKDSKLIFLEKDPLVSGHGGGDAFGQGVPLFFGVNHLPHVRRFTISLIQYSARGRKEPAKRSRTSRTH